MKVKNLAILLILLSFGCSGAVTHSMLTSKSYPPTSQIEIEVFLEKQPTKPYEKIAIISNNLWKENLATNIDWAKKEAAKMGADAIILISTDPVKQSGAFIMSGGSALAGGGASGYRYSFYAIKFIK